MDHLFNVDEDERVSTDIRQILGHLKAGDMTLGEAHTQIIALSENKKWKNDYLFSNLKARLN